MREVSRRDIAAKLGAVAVVAASVVLPAGVSAASVAPRQRSAPASSRSAVRQWTVTLPEKDGISGLGADANRAYVSWADQPEGHSAAVGRLAGHLVWRAKTAEFASELTVADSAVWTTDGGTLVEQESSTGRRLATISSPPEEGFVTIAAAGHDVDALSDGPKHQVLSIYDAAGKLVGRHTTGIASDNFCQEVTGRSDLFVLCLASTDGRWTLDRVATATGKVLASRRLPSGTDGGQSLTYTSGHVYVLEATGAGGPNTTPARVVEFGATNLAVLGRSPLLDLISIASAGPDPVGVEINVRHTPTGVAVLAPDTLAVRRTVPVRTEGSEVLFAADRTDAFVAVSPPAMRQVPEQLIGVSLGG